MAICPSKFPMRLRRTLLELMPGQTVAETISGEEEIQGMSAIEEQERRIRDLALEIERLKASMAAVIARRASFSDPEVVAASKRLDDLMNQYYRLSGVPGPGGGQGPGAAR